MGAFENTYMKKAFRLKNKLTPQFVALLLASSILTGCGAEQIQESNQQEDIQQESSNTQQPLRIIDDNYRTTYEVFVGSFYDSDGDGTGDLQGLIQKLDYINDGDDSTEEDLGCNEIWLMPICPSPTYHKYDVTDYMDIDDAYGSMEDFDDLIGACHERGIRLITDMVINHTSDQHPWFQEAAEYLRQNDPKTSESQNAEQFSEEDLSACPYLDYYNFSKEQKSGYEPLEGTDWYYEARFWSGMPDLNLQSEAVRSELEQVISFWLDHGVDGFRMDAVTSYETDDANLSIQELKWFNDTVKSKKEDAYIVGEAWTAQNTYAKYYESGIDSLFDFAFADSTGIIAGVARGTTSVSRYVSEQVKEQELYASYNSDYVNAPFYTNHDMARSAGYYTGKGAEDKVKLAGGLNLLMSGNAFLYYGEELGMKGSGKDENKRAPMYWSEDSNAEGMCDGPADMDDFEMKYPSYEEQKEDPTSIYNYYKQAIRLRNTYPAIARGEVVELPELSQKNICVYEKKISDDRKEEIGKNLNWSQVANSEQNQLFDILVAINTSDESAEIDLSVDEGANGFRTIGSQLMTGEETASLEEDTLRLPAYGIVILTK